MKFLKLNLSFRTLPEGMQIGVDMMEGCFDVHTLEIDTRGSIGAMLPFLLSSCLFTPLSFLSDTISQEPWSPVMTEKVVPDFHLGRKKPTN